MINDVNIELMNITDIKPHIHSGIECILVIKGRIDLSINENQYCLNQDDFIVINRDMLHRLSGEPSNIILRLFISAEYLKRECGAASMHHINCCLIRKRKDSLEIANTIKEILVRMLGGLINKEYGHELHFKTLLFQLLYILFTNFEGDALESEGTITKQTKSITRILSFINENYYIPLNLQVLAERECISAQYFSIYFKRKTGVGFFAYLQDVRLEHAVKALIHTDDSIIKIAMETGFSSAKSLTTVFKKKYHMTPSQYRLKNKRAWDEDNDIIPFELNVKKKDIRDFLKYVKTIESHSAYNIAVKSNRHRINVNSNPSEQLDFDNFIMIHHIQFLSLENSLDNLLYIRNKLGINIVYFPLEYGENYIYDETMAQQFDLYKSLEFFQNENFTPFMKISPLERYMLLQGNELLKEIKSDIEPFLSKLAAMYPDIFKSKWRFEIIPNGFNRNQAPIYYEAVYQIIRQYMPESKIGIFSVTDVSDTRNFEELLIYCSIRNMLPDFVTFQSFANIRKVQISENSPNTSELKNYHVSVVNEIKTIIVKVGLDDLPIYMTEWNTLAGDEYAEKSTYFRTALIIEDLRNLTGLICGAGFWLDASMCTDSSNSDNISTLALYLFNFSLRPVFYVLEARKRIGKLMIYQDRHVLASINTDGEIIVFAWNPSYLNPVYAMDGIITNELKKPFSFVIEGLKNGLYYIKKFTYNSENSGLLSRAIGSDFPEFHDKDTLEYYQHTYGKALAISDVQIDNNLLELETNIDYNGAVMYVLREAEKQGL